MMNFTTTIPLRLYNYPINYDSKIVLLGSCFAENIGEKLTYFKFQNTVNQFGILFHPLAIEAMVAKAVHNTMFTGKDIFFHNEKWQSFAVHSDLSATDKEQLLVHLNQQLLNFNAQLTEATHIIITYGTSWVYRDIASDTIVANCHKVPQKQFHKMLLSTTSIEESIQNTIASIRKINPDCQFIFTVSPVRHSKDGFVENQRSKSHLIAGLHNTIDNYSGKEGLSEALNYFPSYEIMMDELRDYRFYAEDMLHPNTIAIAYIWERFTENYIQQQSVALMKEVDAIQKAKLHRAFHFEAASHQKFLLQLNQKIAQLQKQLPHIKF